MPKHPIIRYFSQNNHPTVIWALVVLFLSLLPKQNLGEPLFLHFDKLVHIGFYSFFEIALFLRLTILFGQGSKAVFGSILTCFTYSYIIELLQGWLPINRSFDELDLLANVFGIMLGYLVVRFTLKSMPYDGEKKS